MRRRKNAPVRCLARVTRANDFIRPIFLGHTLDRPGELDVAQNMLTI